jgi:D-alanine-D-alanine ligase
MERERIAVVYGGLSHEREISIKSGYNVIASLEKRGSEVDSFRPKKNRTSKNS